MKFNDFIKGKNINEWKISDVSKWVDDIQIKGRRVNVEVKGKTASGQHQEIRDNLFNIFNDQFKEEFNILPIYTYGTTGGGFGGSTTSVAANKIRIKSKDGSFNKVYNVGVNATQEIVDQINEDFKDYMIPVESKPGLPK